MTIKQTGGIFGRNPSFNTLNATTITASGNITSSAGNIVIGTNGKGIDFSAASGANSTSELLDDYEEGTWTPVPKDSSGNVGSASSASGAYTKVGNLVFVTVHLNNINTSGLTSGNNFEIHGLPYTSAALPNLNVYAGSTRMNSITFSGSPNLAILDGAGYMRIEEVISGASVDFLIVSEIASGTSDIYGSLTYMAA